MTHPRYSAIVAAVPEMYGISPETICSRAKHKNTVFTRQIVMYLCRTVKKCTYEYIGAYLGRDHATVMWAVKEIERRRKGDAELDADLNSLADELRPIRVGTVLQI